MAPSSYVHINPASTPLRMRTSALKLPSQFQVMSNFCHVVDCSTASTLHLPDEGPTMKLTTVRFMQLYPLEVRPKVLPPLCTHGQTVPPRPSPRYMQPTELKGYPESMGGRPFCTTCSIPCCGHFETRRLLILTLVVGGDDCKMSMVHPELDQLWP